MIANFLDVEQNLGPLAVFLREVLLHLVNFTSLHHSGDLAGFVSGQLLLLTMASFVIEEPLGVSIPCHNLHVEDVPSHVLIKAVAIFVLLWNVRILTFVSLELDALLFYLF